MNTEELKETNLWALYKKHVNFMNLRHIYADTDKNFRFFNGDQWYGLKVKESEKIQHNFLKRHKKRVIY